MHKRTKYYSPIVKKLWMAMCIALGVFSIIPVIMWLSHLYRTTPHIIGGGH